MRVWEGVYKCHNPVDDWAFSFLRVYLRQDQGFGFYSVRWFEPFIVLSGLVQFGSTNWFVQLSSFIGNRDAHSSKKFIGFKTRDLSPLPGNS